MESTQNDVFRFVVQRPVQRASSNSLLPKVVLPKLSKNGLAHPLKRESMEFHVDEQDDIQKWAEQFYSSVDFIKDLHDLKLPIAELDDWLLNKHNQPQLEELLKQVKDLLNGSIESLQPQVEEILEITQITKNDLSTLIHKRIYQIERERAVNSLVALMILSPPGMEELRRQLLRALCIFGLVEHLALTPELLRHPKDIYAFLLDAIVVLPNIFPVPARALSRVPAIADLKVVRQELLRYELGEIAHIENVLQGESYERLYKTSKMQEEASITETEHEETQEQDLQSTERFELQQAASSIVKEDSHFEAGLTVSAAYGPTVSVRANTGYASNSSKSESTQVASDYARDITKRSESRIREKVREQRLTRTISQVEESNKHGVDNSKGTGHVRGVYRWVNKVYKAQVYNYGKRLQLEFVVPEPAAFIKQVQEKQSIPKVAMKEPEPPTVFDDPKDDKTKRELKPSDITEDKYLDWAAKYYVKDIAPPPEKNIWLSTGWEEATKDVKLDDNNSHKVYKLDKTFKTPAGYLVDEVKGVICVSDYMEDTLITVGGIPVEFIQQTAPEGTQDAAEHPFSIYRGSTDKYSDGIEFKLKFDAEQPNSSAPKISGELAIGLIIENCWGYQISMSIKCLRTEEELEKWQIKTYQQIMTAYFQLKSAYDEQVSAAKAQQGIVIQGSSSDENRLTERNELKKTIISMLEEQHFDKPPVDQDAIEQVSVGSPKVEYSEVNFAIARRERDFIQWFEQAFEWQQMTYVFYPYYWTNKEKWLTELQRNSTDPLFTAFLKAGAARVVVPVRPGFEKAVTLYLATGIIWDGGHVPQVGDPAFVSVIQEIQEQQNANPGGDPDGEPWEVRLPTTLVMLQEDAELPNFS